LSAEPEIRSEVRQIHGLATHLLASGSGDSALLWFPGVGDEAASFRPVLLGLSRRLAGVARVLAVDPPGYWNASAWPRPALPAFTTLYAWAGAVLRDLNPRPASVIVCGNSSGAALAIAAAAHAPRLVRGLISVCWPQWRPGEAPAGAELSPADLVGYYQLLKRSWHHPPRVPALIAQVGLARLSTPSYRAHLESFDALSCQQNLALYKGPVLFVGASSDGLVPAESLQRSAEARPGSRLLWLTECGHYPHREQPQQLTNLLTEFVLERLGDYRGEACERPSL